MTPVEFMRFHSGSSRATGAFSGDQSTMLQRAYLASRSPATVRGDARRSVAPASGMEKARPPGLKTNRRDRAKGNALLRCQPAVDHALRGLDRDRRGAREGV